MFAITNEVAVVNPILVITDEAEFSKQRLISTKNTIIFQTLHVIVFRKSNTFFDIPSTYIAQVKTFKLMGKKRIIKDYDQMPPEIIIQLKEQFPYGYQEHLLRFNNAKGELISALPYETDDIFYLVRMNIDGGYSFIDEDDFEDDFDSLPETEELELDDSEE